MCEKNIRIIIQPKITRQVVELRFSARVCESKAFSHELCTFTPRERLRSALGGNIQHYILAIIALPRTFQVVWTTSHAFLSDFCLIYCQHSNLAFHSGHAFLSSLRCHCTVTCLTLLMMKLALILNSPVHVPF